MALDLPARFDRIDQRFDGVDRRLDTMDRRFDTMDQRFDERMNAHAVEIRRHFDVVAESMSSHFQLVAEGVVSLDRKVDRIADALRGEQTRLGRRLDALAARLPPKRRR
jgi:hypothetical protein